MVLLLTGSIEGTKKSVNEFLESFMRYEVPEPYTLHP